MLFLNMQKINEAFNSPLLAQNFLSLMLVIIRLSFTFTFFDGGSMKRKRFLFCSVKSAAAFLFIVSDMSAALWSALDRGHV